MRLIEIATQTQQAPGVHDRRRHVRSATALNAEVVDRQSGRRIHGVTANISVGGCFIQSSDPLALGTAVRLVLAFGNRRFHCSAIVAHLSAGIGMGLSFPRFDALEWLTQSSKTAGANAPR
jgi:PilZ domain